VEGTAINAKNSSILTINGGSSSIKFGLFEVSNPPRSRLYGEIGGIGQKQAHLRVVASPDAVDVSRNVNAPDHTAAADVLSKYIEESDVQQTVVGIGHRVVQGGPKYWEPQRVTAEMLKELRTLSAFDPEHLPDEIRLIEAFSRRFLDVSQVACFDTAFHHDLPLVARLLPIPRRYEAQGLRRYGFHGLSYAYLIEELARVAGKEAATGRVILAHLGSGASLAAVRGGKSVDTSMGLTPASGVPMSTRSGDLDPGLMGYLALTEQMTPAQFTKMINFESGLLGISETSADMQELIDQEILDARAADAVALFCYQVKKTIGAFAAALGGVDILVFSGGIGENAPTIRARICEGLGFLGIVLDSQHNAQNSLLISTDGAAVQVRVIATDEASMIAKSVMSVFKLGKT
jgi:acetate kinase